MEPDPPSPAPPEAFAPPAVAEPPAPESKPLPIAFDLACIGCQYNLRTLTAAATCPECGRSVRETLQAFSRGWSPAEIDVWRSGCKWVGISGVLTAVVPAVGLANVFLGSFWFDMLSEVAVFGLVILTILAEHAVWVLGVLQLSRGHPGVGQVSLGAITRLRAAVILNGLVALVAVLLPFLADWLGVREDNWLLLWGVLLVFGVTARAVAVGGLMRLVSRTLGAAGQLWKRRHILVTGTVVIILCAAQGLATLATVIGAGDFGNEFFGFGAVVGIGSLFALPVIAVWASVSVFRAGAAFKLPSL